MVIHTAPKTTALQAQATANLFLNDHLPDRFTADQPYFDSAGNVWHVPVILVYPCVDALGQVGEILISPTTETVVASTPLDEMQKAAQALYTVHRDAIETAFS